MSVIIRRTQEPEATILSGYSMCWLDFQKLAIAMSTALAAQVAKEGPQPDAEYICEFDIWRFRLPRELREETPIPRIIYARKREKDEGTVGRNRVFFETRFIDTEDNLSVEDYPGMRVETDLDRNRRDKFIEFIEERVGFVADKSRLEFQVLKYYV